MSLAGLRWMVFLGLVCMLPLPMWGIQTGLVPVARLLELGLVCMAVVVLENARGAGPILGILFLVQGALYAGILWWAVSLSVRHLEKQPPKTRLGIVFGLLGIGLLLTSSLEIYRTPFRAESSRSSLLQVYQ